MVNLYGLGNLRLVSTALIHRAGLLSSPKPTLRQRAFDHVLQSSRSSAHKSPCRKRRPSSPENLDLLMFPASGTANNHLERRGTRRKRCLRHNLAQCNLAQCNLRRHPLQRVSSPRSPWPRLSTELRCG
ncbi:hypothetical protein N658DRAFT_166050 [Parathielavia hyrcaniae]|uniref:Uncharacterized protein n=1 Tax=Parathielavia hyrcaniae TaxID=113614 RepID=A0AAN6PX94_9PEZI|nr:hypothetical protein N658DRAFT_166050 [Parathielavia hyrcaniae]